MTDLMERLVAADPAREHQRPPMDEVWRKVDAESAVADRAPWRQRGGRALLGAATALPVIAIVLIALSAGGARHAPSHTPPAVAGGHRGRSTIDPAVQRSAVRALDGRSGSVVVMNPKTGAVEAMAQSGAVRVGAHAAVPPGATFDVVTVATALGSGRYGPGSLVSGTSPLGAGRSQVRNDEGQNFGRVTLRDALRFSVNTVFARVGIDVGAGALTRQMRLFQLPAAPASGVAVALGPLAAGQGSVTATPLQLASIAAAIANGGRLAAPHVQTLAGPVSERTVMTARTARLLTGMLRGVVTQGTGTAANLHGLNVAGKTGTAPANAAGGGHGTVASFIGFAPADHPTVAIAVVLAVPHGGFGGTTAAPIAARVIRDALRGPR